jgi:four helix bundle protein
MGASELLRRTKEFDFNIIQILNKLPYSVGNNTIKNQLVRSATGMAANYRASIKSRSLKEFTARLGVVIEEADESWFWLDLLEELNPTRRIYLNLNPKHINLQPYLQAL